MDTDPNPFRDSPDIDRSSSPSEAPDNSTRDFTLDNDVSTTGGSSPMSDDEDAPTSSEASSLELSNSDGTQSTLSSTETSDAARLDQPV